MSVIWVVTDGFPPDHVGGISKSVVNEIGGLVDQGHQVVVVTRVSGVKYSFGIKVGRNHGALVIRYGFCRRSSLLYFSHFLLTVLFLPFVLRAISKRLGRPEAIYVHGPFQAAACALTNLTKAGYHYVFHASSHRELQIELKNRRRGIVLGAILRATLPLVYFCEALGISRAKAIMARSKFMESELRECFGWFVRRIPISVIPLMIDVDSWGRWRNTRDLARRSMGLPGATFVFFTARRLVARMGLMNLIRAVRIIEDSCLKTQWTLLIAGRGHLHNVISQMIVDQNISTVRLLGFIKEEELSMYYAGADVFVLPTEEYEGFGLVTIESFASGTPVLATPVAANVEVVGGWSSNWLTKSSSAQDLANGMIAAINRIEKDGVTIRQSAYNHCRSTFDSRVVSAQICNFLDVIEGPKCI
jgi:glycosyltransferase involved in cell wall biosynthesis